TLTLALALIASSLPVRRRQRCALLVAALPSGDTSWASRCHSRRRHFCGCHPSRAGSEHYPYGLTAGKSLPLRAGRRRVLPLWPGRYSYGKVIGKRCPYGLVPGEHRPLRVGDGRAPLLWPWPCMAAL
ncbi:hypothetical protein B296_00040476, partial [Ensete ventricosum]